MLTNKRKGRDPPIRQIGQRPEHFVFIGNEQSRTKIKDLDRKSRAKTDLSGRTSKQKVDLRQSHKDGSMRSRIGHAAFDNVVPAGKKAGGGGDAGTIFRVARQP